MVAARITSVEQVLEVRKPIVGNVGKQLADDIECFEHLVLWPMNQGLHDDNRVYLSSHVFCAARR